MTVPFKDHFSGHAASYAAHRPTYPAALFAYLASLCPERRRAWDCASGNGQAARDLLAHFAQVIATDASFPQLRRAQRERGLHLVLCRGEAAALRDRSVDLITVAQALHWLDLEAFYDEARRVGRPGGIVAVWCYGLHEVTPAVDEVLKAFHDGTVGRYWPPERRHIDEGYRSLVFPFAEIEAPDLAMEARRNLEELLGYLRTWSAVRRYLRAERADPVEALVPSLRAAWGDTAATRTVRWPLHLRVGRIGAAPAGA